jgi:secreted trypsin-like serine protease
MTRQIGRMLASLLAPLILVAGCGDEQPTEDSVTITDEIIGGTTTAVGAWPFQAQIKLTTAPHWCGGSLLTPDWVLTAAHCLQDSSGNDLPLSTFRVVMGEHDRSSTDGAEQTRTVSLALKNPGYPGGASPGHFDTALLRLSTPVTLDSRVQTIRPAVDRDDSGQNAIVSGWGNTSPGSGATNVLRQASVPIAANSACNSAPSLNRDLFSDELCAGFLDGTRGGCHGDSGGPLSVERNVGTREVVGVVSWGQGGQCGTYTVFGRVKSQVGWIRTRVIDVAAVPPRTLLLL